MARYPNQAEPLVWQGIVVSEQANRANFLHKLGLATQARDLLARAYAINPRAANGGGAMSLGLAEKFYAALNALVPRVIDNGLRPQIAKARAEFSLPATGEA